MHVQHATGEAKFWLDPELALAANFGLSGKHVAAAERLAREHYDDICAAWDAHFKR